MMEEKAPPACSPLSTASRACSRGSRRKSESLMGGSLSRPRLTASSSLRNNSRLDCVCRDTGCAGLFMGLTPGKCSYGYMCLLNRPAAVDHQHMANHHIGKGTGEKQNGAYQVLGLIPSSAGKHLVGRPFFVSGPFEDV